MGCIACQALHSHFIDRFRKNNKNASANNCNYAVIFNKISARQLPLYARLLPAAMRYWQSAEAGMQVHAGFG